MNSSSVADEIRTQTKRSIEEIFYSKRGLVLVFEGSVEKIRPKLNSPAQTDARVRTLLTAQGVFLSESNISLPSGTYRRISIKRFPEGSSVAERLHADKMEGLAAIVSGHKKLATQFPNSDIDVETYWHGLHSNFYAQMQWARANIPESTYADIYTLFLDSWEIVTKESRGATRPDPSLKLCHGDIHAGNVYFHEGMFIFLDPAESSSEFYTMPVWADFAAFVGSLFLLGKKEAALEFTRNLSGQFGQFHPAHFVIWMLIKLMVRLRFEKEFIAENEETARPCHLGWRKFMLANMETGIKECVVACRELIQRQGRAQNPQSISSANRLLDTLELRRSEVNAKANVYTAISIALIAANIAFLNSSSTAFQPPIGLLVVSSLIALLALWFFLALISGLPKWRRSKSGRGRLFFFGWIEETRQQDIKNILRQMDHELYIEEVVLQAKSISANLRFRYRQQKLGIRILTISFLVFVVAIYYSAIGSTNVDAGIEYLVTEAKNYWSKLW